MKKIIVVLFVAVFIPAQNGQSQGFVNLDFESANVSGYKLDRSTGARKKQKGRNQAPIRQRATATG